MREDCMKDYGKDYDYPICCPQMPMMGGGYPMYPQMGPQMGMPYCPPMGNLEDADAKELCYMEHMNEYMAYMCKAEAARVRAMQCMKK